MSLLISIDTNPAFTPKQSAVLVNVEEVFAKLIAFSAAPACIGLRDRWWRIPGVTAPGRTDRRRRSETWLLTGNITCHF
ncbi:hypothetical protein LB543_22605 [Mesorhizobium sp. ESP7-2]|uniref:hypothetical protein n=1 Tax=Mesorhizobium sp. ESP7-2 TaxID=2876622 RepID=UPI001CD000BE|nr:hypothetical protein [Mesorhizobium sp. ESP7-2]MBZ9709511.1 hypothetical protein [Mesorhizobium sp. ESP7-2]